MPRVGNQSSSAVNPGVFALPGEPAFWTFIAADSGLFALLFLQYCLDRASHLQGFIAEQSTLAAGIAVVNTVILVTSSWALAVAVQHASGGDRRLARQLVFTTSALGACFAALKVVEYILEIRAGHSFVAGTFFMYYFIITGIHLVHLLIGVLALTFIGARCVRDSESSRDTVILECGASYWHLIDLLWMFIFPLTYLAR